VPRARVGGIELYYETHGWDSDADVVVLSNGVLMSTTSWAYQVPALARRFRLLLYDARGMWRSDHPPGPYTMELHASDLAGLLDAVGVDRAHIAGISYGGEVSLQFALSYPERTRSLFVASAVSEVGPLVRATIEAWIAAAEARDPGLLHRLVVATGFSERWAAAHPDEIAQARSRYAALDFRAVAELCRCFLRLDLTGELHRIQAPTLVLAGEEDVLKPRGYAAQIAREIPGAQLLMVPAAGHALCLERPAEFNTALVGFLAQHAEKMKGGDG